MPSMRRWIPAALAAAAFTCTFLALKSERTLGHTAALSARRTLAFRPGAHAALHRMSRRLPTQCEAAIKASDTKLNSPDAKYTVVFLRHGESTWNAKNLFTGWADVGLSDKGVGEGKSAGQALKNAGFEFDLAYTSMLKRAIQTLNFAVSEMDADWLPVIKDWQLNERHYGALEGLNKAETAAKHGEDMVKIWRRSYDTPPPPLEDGDDRDKSVLPQYSEIPKQKFPLSESLKDTVDRVLPFWDSEITQSIKSGKRVLVAAHGNSLRALVKHLDGMSDDEITGLNIPTGIPLVYELDENMKPVDRYYLADESVLNSAVNAVANQGKAK
jgi:2,3-bisphosphoglycerate-dependent phosphoglycerate mutase